MKGLLFLALVGAAIYGAIVLSYNLLPHHPAENVFTRQSLGNPDDRQLRSWGTDLPALASSSSQGSSLALGKPATTTMSPSRVASLPVSQAVPASLLMDGLQDLLAAAETQAWRLDENRGELMGWIDLFPFSDAPVRRPRAVHVCSQQAAEAQAELRLHAAYSRAAARDQLWQAQGHAAALHQTSRHYPASEPLRRWLPRNQSLRVYPRSVARRVARGASRNRSNQRRALCRRGCHETISRTTRLPHRRPSANRKAPASGSQSAARHALRRTPPASVYRQLFA